MYLLTTNPGNKARRIERVSGKEIFCGYNHFANKPMLTFYVHGQDGIKYTIRLDDNDIQRIVAAREKYDEHFTAPQETDGHL